LNPFEAAMFDKLRGRFGDGWALFPQVPDGTGGNKRRTADAMAMQLWPSRGLTLHGFEFKRSRSDWLRELRDPEKADGLVCLCDAWWVVAEPDVVKKDELPPGWGLLVTTDEGTKLAQGVTITYRGDSVPRDFVAGLLRAAARSTLDDVVAEAVKRADRTGYQRGVEAERERHRIVPNEVERLRQSVESFEAASGIKIDEFRGESLGEAVAAISRLAPHWTGLGSLVDRLLETADHVRALADQLDPNRESKLVDRYAPRRKRKRRRD
jgi:hypothetical protein